MRHWRPEFGWLVLASFVLLLGVWWIPGPDTLSSDSYSVTHGGKKGFYRVLRAFEEQTQRDPDQLVSPTRNVGTLLILGPVRYPTETEWTAIAAEVANGMTLVVAAPAYGSSTELKPFGIWIQFPKDARHDGDSNKGDKPSKQDEAAKNDVGDGKNEPQVAAEDSKSEPKSEAKAESSDEPKSDEDKKQAEAEKDVKRLVDRMKRRGRLAKTDLVSGDVNWIGSGHLELASAHAEVLLTVDDQPCVVRQSYGSGAIVVCSSDEIFSNVSMLDANRALLAYRIVERVRLQTPIVFDESLNGSGVPKVFGSLFAPAIRPITLQLFLILVLFGWAGSRRFGPAAPPIDKPRRSIVEHAEALGSLYYRAHAGAQVLAHWFEHLRLELRLTSKNGLSTSDVEMLARCSKSSVDDVRDLLRATASEAGAQKASNATVASLIQRLAQLREKIAHRHQKE